MMETLSLAFALCVPSSLWLRHSAFAFALPLPCLCLVRSHHLHQARMAALNAIVWPAIAALADAELCAMAGQPGLTAAIPMENPYCSCSTLCDGRSASPVQSLPLARSPVQFCAPPRPSLSCATGSSRGVALWCLPTGWGHSGWGEGGADGGSGAAGSQVDRMGR